MGYKNHIEVLLNDFYQVNMKALLDNHKTEWININRLKFPNKNKLKMSKKILDKYIQYIQTNNKNLLFFPLLIDKNNKVLLVNNHYELFALKFGFIKINQCLCIIIDNEIVLDHLKGQKEKIDINKVLFTNSKDFKVHFHVAHGGYLLLYPTRKVYDKKNQIMEVTINNYIDLINVYIDYMKNLFNNIAFLLDSNIILSISNYINFSKE
ncbi:MAG: hypothetical protein ACOCP8_04450 [archaeon]